MTDLKEITWKIQQHVLPCFCYQSEIATHKGKIHYGGATINVCLCPECLQLADSAIMAGALPRGVRN